MKLADFDEALAEGKIVYIGEDTVERYFENVQKQSIHSEIVKASGFKVVYTPLNGTGNKPVRTVLGRIGVNVNQIAHWANANEHITAEQVAELRASFDRIERLLGDLFANKRTAGKDV